MTHQGFTHQHRSGTSLLHTVEVAAQEQLFLRSDLDRVQQAGAGAVLVGEALMRQDDVEAGLRSLIAG